MLEIQRSIDADNVRFVLSGRLERQHFAELQRLIDEEAPHNVVTLDLEEILAQSATNRSRPASGPPACCIRPPVTRPPRSIATNPNLLMRPFTKVFGSS
jgi:hypothetical protein